MREEAPGSDDPIALVPAGNIVPTVRQGWLALSPNKDPEKITIVSPFWPVGDSAADALGDLVRQLGSPANLELDVPELPVARWQGMASRV